MIEALTKIIKDNQKQGMVVAEIGAWTGETTIDYIDIIKRNKGKCYIVDWFSGNSDIGNHPSERNHIHAYKPENSDAIYEKFMKNLEGYHDCIEVLRGKSEDMIKKIKDGELDICFIDADHTYEGCLDDINKCLPKVKENGIICGHDCEYIEMGNMFNDIELNVHYLHELPRKVAEAGAHVGPPDKQFIVIDKNGYGKKITQNHFARFKRGFHPGVIQAVFDTFGYNIKSPRGNGDSFSVWLHKKGEIRSREDIEKLT